ncbi:hypothetical protein J2S49_000530 [Arcanobacterium wilhelmae]|uniref:LPXTG-motif cell wall anchor domain-containing protein n=1 Tax=Arcanobacterium wilhelmae TaxID=1803177 RepID=A0ABT9N9S2_9ACTO|nr:hypothetical protein [Arcanobacterium wilhelmae]MDP9800454.1 hypothetical protein [Arcanobacterium wilhelmae]WFN89874.1 hypothetical protein P8A24_06665 [Arcanobacterium wilhelmae]
MTFQAHHNAARRGTVILALTGVIALAPLTAHAQTITGDTPKADVTCDAGSLAISMPTPNPFDKVAPGQLKDPSGIGVELTAKQVKGYDLTRFANWAGIDKLTVADAEKAGFVGEPHVAVTGKDAVARFGNLPIGLYVVSATMPHVPGYKVSQMDPFIVSVPLGEGDHWDCSVEIAAKTHFDVTPEPTTPPSTPPSTPPTVPPTVPPPPGVPPVPPPLPPTGTPPTPPRLPWTGASVAAAGIAAFGLIGTGSLLAAKRRKNDEENDR